MSVTAAAFVVASSLYTGFQWTIRVVVYPQFAAVGAAAFPRYERDHQRRVSVAVGPLFAALVVTAALLLAVPDGASRAPAAVGAAAVLAVLGVTALLAVPLHRRLGAGFDAAAHRRLLAVDTVRLVAAAVATVAGIVALAG